MKSIIKEKKINNLHLLVLFSIALSIYSAITIIISFYTYEASTIINTPIINTPYFEIFSSWIEGNLGKMLALIGFVGTFFIYMITNKPAVLMFGIILSLIAGGMVGISSIFFDAGVASFALDS